MTGQVAAPGALCTMLQEIAWRDFVTWAFDSHAMRAAFKAATGRDVGLGHTAIDRAIDETTERRADAVQAFVFWVTENHWGRDEAPASVRQAIEGRLAAGGALW